MATKINSSINKKYIASVTILTFIVPPASLIIEHLIKETPVTFELFGKWFIFSAVGLRLFVAGIKQATDPGFTAKEIFHIHNTESFPLIRELGFANICFGLIGIASVFMPSWRIVSAFGSGLYYGIAGLQHLFRKLATTNEKFALITDIIIFILLAAYFITMI